MILQKDENATADIPTVDDDKELSSYGVHRVPIPEFFDCERFGNELSQVTPMILTAEDGEYAFYRNILEEPDFPFEEILQSSIGEAIVQHFDIDSVGEIRLDDAFCIHMNTLQEDTTGAKHQDPSDITVNMCLQKAPETKGSMVLFHGTQKLENADHHERGADFKFKANQRAGTATLHWGRHPHETTALESGMRTNIILTYCYKDSSRSDVSSRNCYS